MKKFLLFTLVLLTIFGCTTAKKPASNTSDEGWVDTRVIFTDDGLTLREAAEKSGMYIGAGVKAQYIDARIYSGTTKNHFNYVTAENCMKWGPIHPEPDVFRWDGADKVVNFAMENDIKVRGHVLVWHSQAPGYIINPDVPWNKESLTAALKHHIDSVVGRYKGKIHAWDVLNEALEGSNYRGTVFYEVLGKDYIPMIFQMAHEADPDALLYYNDYGADTLSAKSDAMYKMVRELLDDGVPIHGVGLQGHLTLSKNWNFESFYKNIKRFSDLGLMVDLTELDIRIKEPISDEELQLQAQWYKKLVEIMIAVENCNTIVIWGVTDALSWIPNHDPGHDGAVIFDDEYKPKPAFFSIREALEKGPVELEFDLISSETKRRAIPPFVAREVGTVPVIDGKISEDEWSKGIIYPMGFNQLDVEDHRPPADPANLSVEWTLVYSGKTAYGMIKRTDDVTFTGAGNSYESDAIEVFFELKDQFAQLRTLVGSDFESHSYEGNQKAVWSADGTILEFSVEMPGNGLANMIAGWNIALSDNDGDGRERQLYPVAGQNDSWQGVNLGSIRFEGTSPLPPEDPKIVIPFHANKVSGISVDGVFSKSEWSEAVNYPFLFNQLNENDQMYTRDYTDLRGEWGIVYDGKSIYGYVLRTDDVTYTDAANVWENDSVEIFLEIKKDFIQLRTLVGEDWGESDFTGERTAVWSEDGKVLEFRIDLKSSPETLKIIGFNIALADNDGGDTREAQLYPIYGFNDSWQGINLAELEFVKW